jgi:predicted hotdog family 3-hydroxylacyl-ACP dehydratase
MRQPQSIPIEELIPHRKPIILIDVLLEVVPGRGLASKIFRRGDYGVRGDRVCETALIECVAQTTAALFGYGQLECPGEAGLGFLAGLSSFIFFRSPRIDEPLLIEARLGKGFGEMFMVQGKVFAGAIGGECVAEGELKIYLKNGKM